MAGSVRLALLVVAATHNLHYVRAGEGSVLEFDRFGRLTQLEHTRKATQRGTSSVGVCLTSCAVVACWPRCGGIPQKDMHNADSEASSDRLPSMRISSGWLDPPPLPSDVTARLLAHPAPVVWRLSDSQAVAAAGLAGDAQVWNEMLADSRSASSLSFFIRQVVS
jgi:hypothetical protein